MLEYRYKGWYKMMEHRYKGRQRKCCNTDINVDRETVGTQM